MSNSQSTLQRTISIVAGGGRFLSPAPRIGSVPTVKGVVVVWDVLHEAGFGNLFTIELHYGGVLIGNAYRYEHASYMDMVDPDKLSLHELNRMVEFVGVYGGIFEYLWMVPGEEIPAGLKALHCDADVRLLIDDESFQADERELGDWSSDDESLNYDEELVDEAIDNVFSRRGKAHSERSGGNAYRAKRAPSPEPVSNDVSDNDMPYDEERDMDDSELRLGTVFENLTQFKQLCKANAMK
ncbi:hypothetical protein LINPERPRIM_LOCUS33728 [Linum perenne]